MKKYLYSFAIVALIFTSCSKNDILNNNDIASITPQKETIETDFFSVDYKYSQTIRVYSETKNEYVDVLVSSDKEDVLKSHLNRCNYEINNANEAVTNDVIQSVGEEKLTNTDNSKFVTLDDSNIPKIRVELIAMSKNLNNFNLKCKLKATQNQTGIQKMQINPSPWYYEYSSGVHECYGKVKFLDLGSLLQTYARYGYTRSWLGKIHTWPNGQYALLSGNMAVWCYDVNSFGFGGADYENQPIYKLYTGIRSYSPENFDLQFSKNPIPNW